MSLNRRVLSACCTIFTSCLAACASQYVLPDSYSRDSMTHDQARETLLRILQPSSTNVGSCVVNGLNAGSLREGKGPLVLKDTVLEFPAMHAVSSGSSVRSTGSVSAGTYSGAVTMSYRLEPTRYTMDLAKVDKIRVKKVELEIPACGGRTVKSGYDVAEIPLGDTSAYVFFIHEADMNSFVKAFATIAPNVRIYQGMGYMK